MNIFGWLSDWRDDFRFSARALRRDGFVAAVIVITLALGIGANAAMFGIIDDVLLRGPAHVVDSHAVQRLYLTHRNTRGEERSNSTVGYVAYTLLRQDTHDFDGVAAYNIQSVPVGKDLAARALSIGYATASMFPMLGVQPALGRFFNDTEDRLPRGDNVAVVDWSFAQSEFGEVSRAVGRETIIGGLRYTIIGVAPRGFTGPQLGPVDMWVPISTQPPTTTDWADTWKAQWLSVVVRMHPGVDMSALSAKMSGRFNAAAQAAVPAHRKEALSFLPLHYTDAGHESVEMRIARWLVAVSIVVLLVACANVANLLIARAVRRQRETGVRLALGVSKARLVRLLLSEGLLLAAAGSIAAIAVTAWSGRVIRTVLLPDVQWTGSPVTKPVILYGALLMLISGLLIGLAPALQAVRQDLVSTLRGGAREGGGRSRVRNALTVMQAAFSALLLIGGGLFVHSLWNISRIDLGIQPDRVLAAQVKWAPFADTATAARLAEKTRRNQLLLDAARTIARRPDVDAASVAVGLPFINSFGVDLRIPGLDTFPDMPGGGPFISAVASDYFKTAGTRLLHGRDFTPADRAGSEPVMIVNATMAQTIWHTDAPIGKCAYIGKNNPPCARVVGVVQDAKRDGFRDEPALQYYIPYGQEKGFGGTVIVIRPKRKTAAALRAQLPKMLPALLPGITYQSETTLQELIDPQIRPWKLGAAMFGTFGALALVIAGIGLFSVIAYSVARRRSELGIRLALGARSRNIVSLILRDGLALAMTGIALGILLSLPTGRYLEPMLYHTRVVDPVVFVGVAAALLLTAIAACIVPAARASRLNPVSALSAE